MATTLLKSNGEIDTSFGDQGSLVFNLIGGESSLSTDQINGVGILPNGEILISGQTANTSDTDIFVMKLK